MIIIHLNLFMIGSKLSQVLRRFFSEKLLTFSLFVCILLVLNPSSALAGLNDDNFDGNIFALYGGNGSLVPPRVTLAESLKQARPALLVFYLDDSQDCKQYTTTVSQLQRFYGRAADFIPVNVDAILPNFPKVPTEPVYYYKGVVPQTVLINQSGKVVFDGKGQVDFEQVDDVFREVFNLLPRSESIELKRKPLNEINTDFVTVER